MSSRAVLISSSSVEVLFEGCLMKAPPLNRRGRKKWHERYFILKANRTLECHKSKKAAGAQKSPRRIVDLRECINLEIGLEYKRLQHIMSLGTFKRTFFYAAPSDPLMLQWADVLEKAKNAKDGEFIEILDIGLRKTKDVHAFHTVKTSPSPSHSYGSGSSPKRISPGGKNGMALSHFTNGSTETVDLRNLGNMTNTRHSPSTSEGSRTTSGSISRYPSITSEQSTTSATSSINNSPVRTMSGLGSPKASRRAQSTGVTGIHVTIPNKVPPPNGFLVQASRDKDGFFVNHKRKDYRMFLEKNAEASSPEKAENNSLEREFIPKEGHLRRNHVVKGHPVKSQHPKVITKYRDLAETNHDSSPEEGRDRMLVEKGQRSEVRDQRLGPSSEQGAAIFRSNLKRSFRYRKIALRKEFESPLFPTKENSDSEDEFDEDLTSSVPGAIANFPPLSGHSVGSNLTSIPDEVEISNTDLTTPGPHIDNTVVQRRNNRSASQNASTMSFAGYSPGNFYSKVTVTGPRRSSSSSIPGKRPVVYARSNSFNTKKQISVEDHSPVTTPLSADDNALILPPPLFTGENSISGVDMIDLPARPPSDSFLYGSHNSLDNILVDPPDMFSSEQPEPTAPEFSPKSKRKLSRTRKIGNTLSAKEKVGGDPEAGSNSWQGSSIEKGESKKSRSSSGTENESEGNSIPKQHGNQSVSGFVSNNVVVPDRDSTESCDTGYTSSSTSPGYTEGGQKHTKLKYPDRSTDSKEDKKGRHVPPATNFSAAGQSSLKSIPSLTSLASISSDTSRSYIPLVFHSPRIKGAGVIQDPNMFSVQVCLVENSDELIKDLVTLKSLESFSVMEADQIHGIENVAAAQVDDFTVETSLEDLEFGFSIIKSTQKDLFMRKVRQFTFEIRNLFGTSKPFSCDVEIRHADQLTVLPIEVM